jgi:hypothetical protein
MAPCDAEQTWMAGGDCMAESHCLLMIKGGLFPTGTFDAPV